MTSLIKETSVVLGFHLSILGDDIFRSLERIERYQPYYTTLAQGAVSVSK